MPFICSILLALFGFSPICSERHYFPNITMSVNTLNVYDSKSFSCTEIYLGNSNLYSPLVHSAFYNRMQVILINPGLLSCHLMQMETNMIILPLRNSPENIMNSKYQCKNITSRSRILITLLIISGKVHVHPGPQSSSTNIPWILNLNLTNFVLVRILFFCT